MEKKNIKSCLYLASTTKILVFIGTLLLAVTAYRVLTYGQPTSQENKATNSAPFSPFESPIDLVPTFTSTRTLDLPELYPKIQWKATVSGKFHFITLIGNIIEVDGHHVESATLMMYPTDFIAYYRRELTTRGWKLTEITDSPGRNQHFYEKDKYFVAFGVSVISKKGQPFKYQAFLQTNISDPQ